MDPRFQKDNAKLEEVEVALGELDRDVVGLAPTRAKIAKNVIRWTLTALLYWWFWDVRWLRWTLLLVVPLVLVNLLGLTLLPRLLRRRRDRAARAVSDLEVQVVEAHLTKDGRGPN